MTSNKEALFAGRQFAGIKYDLGADFVAAHFARGSHQTVQQRLHINAIRMFARQFRIQT